MKSWQRSPRRLNCGYCMAEIHIGDPLFVLAPRDGGSWRQFRCAACAGEPVPADLPAAEPVSSPKGDPVRLRPLAELAADWKAKASGA